MSGGRGLRPRPSALELGSEVDKGGFVADSSQEGHTDGQAGA